MIDTGAVRKKILDLAICGKLSVQNTEIESAQNDFQKLDLVKKNLLNNKLIKKEKIAESASRDIPFEIPENWRWCQLSDLCKTVTDGTHKTPTYIEQGIPFLSVKNVSSGVFDFENVKYISEQEHEELLKRCKPELGDVLFCRIGTLGKAIEIDFEPSFSIFVSLGLIKPLDSYLSKYLVNVFNSSYGDYWIDKSKAGDSMHAAKINLDILRSFMVPLPPREEQERIVEKIKETFEVVDEIDNLQEAYDFNLETLRNKIIDSAIQGKLTEQLLEDGTAEELYVAIQEQKNELIKKGKIKKEKILPEIKNAEIPFEIPTTWKWVRLRDICKKIVDGDHNPPAGVSAETKYLMLSAQNINDDKLVNIESARYLTKDVFIEEDKRTRLEKGDVLLTIVATLGRSCVYREELNVCFQRSVCVISSLINPDYLKRYFDSSYIQKFMQDNATGAAQPGFYLNKVERLCIPLPPMNEQKRIVDRIEALLKFI